MNQKLEEAIALQQGWRCEFIEGNGRDCDMWISPGGTAFTEPPPFARCLNTMQKAVLSIDRKTLMYSDYCSHLQQIVAVFNLTHSGIGLQALDASAPQRAEAFALAHRLDFLPHRKKLGH